MRKANVVPVFLGKGIGKALMSKVAQVGEISVHHNIVQHVSEP